MQVEKTEGVRRSGRRTAVVSPYTLGTLSAQKRVIEGLSEALRQPAADMQRLFYALMTQAGVDMFRVHPELQEQFKSLHFLSGRMTFKEVSSELSLADLDQALASSIRSSARSEETERLARELATFIWELDFASSASLPIVSCSPIPSAGDFRDLFYEEAALICETLLASVQSAEYDSPGIARAGVDQPTVARLVSLVGDGYFRPYVEAHSELESSEEATAVQATAISAAARTLVAKNSGIGLKIRRAGVATLGATPALLEAIGGSFLGRIAKPFAERLAAAMSEQRQVVLYSFDPAWRRVFESKLDVVRQVVRRERELRLLLGSEDE